MEWEGRVEVVSLTKHRTLAKVEDEQLHVLPLYIPAKTDEAGSEEGQQAKVPQFPGPPSTPWPGHKGAVPRQIEAGHLEVLDKYPMLMRFRREPLPNCKVSPPSLPQCLGPAGKDREIVLRNGIKGPVPTTVQLPLSCLPSRSVLL